MVEIPDYLLERSREARARLTGADPGGEATSESSSETAVATTEAAPVEPVVTEPEIEKVEPPKPIAPWVLAAQERKKIPVWMAPVALFIPIWAFMIWGTL